MQIYYFKKIIFLRYRFTSYSKNYLHQASARLGVNIGVKWELCDIQIKYLSFKAYLTYGTIQINKQNTTRSQIINKHCSYQHETSINARVKRQMHKTDPEE